MTVVGKRANGARDAVMRAEELAGTAVCFVAGDVRDRAMQDRLFRDHAITAVLQLAGVKAVGESVEQPLKYYDHNVRGSLPLCQAMADAGVDRLISSSSATVYGDCHPMPLHEQLPVGQPANPYGPSRLMVEQMLADLAATKPGWRIGVLRYFNPVGAHESGRIGEAPQGRPNNLVAYIAQVAAGQCKSLAVFGNDYPPPDGTGVRDYIDATKLVDGQLAALQALDDLRGMNSWNLAMDNGYSVLEVVRAFAQASGVSIAHHIVPRRAGDLAQCWAEATKAEHDLGWVATRGLEATMTDTWRWQRMESARVCRT